MIFKCEAEQLKQIIQKLNPQSQENLIVSWYRKNGADLRFSFDGQDKLLCAFRDTFERIPVEGIKQGIATVHWDVFVDLVSKVKDGKLTLDITDNKIEIYK